MPLAVTDTMLLWLACAAAVCAGYYIAFALLGAAIEREHGRTEDVSAIVLSDARILAQRPVLDAQERATEGRIGALALRAGKPALVARFIRVATRVAAAEHVEVVDIDERAAADIPTSPSAPVPSQQLPLPASDANALQVIPLDVTLSGTYRALLATICGLAQAPLAMRIEIAAIERDATTTDNTSGGPLTARLHIELQRLADLPTPAARPAHI